MLNQVCRRTLQKSNCFQNVFRTIHTTSVNTTFWEKEKKSGYGKKYPYFSKQMMLDGFKQLGEEIKLWKEEMKEKIESDPLIVARPGETDIAWRFTGSINFLISKRD
jgi:NADH dehydrogenase [ubiquinone] 1 alpha subcomplex assembly factor 1